LYARLAPRGEAEVLHFFLNLSPILADLLGRSSARSSSPGGKRKAMHEKRSGKRPLRRGTTRGRQDSGREGLRGMGHQEEDDHDKSWTKKYQEGELDDLLITGNEEDDLDGGDEDDAGEAHR
jgi:hypothetical protein